MSEPAAVLEQANGAETFTPSIVTTTAPALPGEQPATFPAPSNPAQVPIKLRGGKLAPPITKANASEMGKRSANARAEKKRARELQPDAISLRRAQQLAQQITRAHGYLLKNGDRLEARDCAALMTALDRLIERERVLRGIPGPGNFRPSRSRSQATTSRPSFEE